jgi:hypothetical protein
MRKHFFEAIKALFPRSRAFEMFALNAKRLLFEALSELPENIRRETELVYFDLFPDTTRCPERWESVFSIYLTTPELAKRRNIIDVLWKQISGDEGTHFLELVLRKIDAGFKVVENVPVVDPRSQQSVMLCVCDYVDMVCDNDNACCDYREGDDTFIPSILQNDTSSIYAIPDDADYWEMCFFVCKEVLRNESNEIMYVEPLNLDIVWKNIVEYLILKIKPVQSTAIVFVRWQEENAA